MEGVFLARWENGSPVLPPMFSAEDGLQLQYTDESGRVRGGYSLLDEWPSGGTIRVLVDASADTIEAMASDEKWTRVE